MVTTTRRDALMRHIARYGVTLRPAVERAFPNVPSTTLDHDLKLLVKENLVQMVRHGVSEPADPRSKYSYYHLTPRACDYIGCPPSRADQSDGLGLKRNLGLLWYCFLGKLQARRLEESELYTLFGLPHRSDSKDRIGKHLARYHCIVKRLDHFQIQSMYVTEASTRGITKEISNRISDVKHISKASKALSSREYAFTILVASRDRQKALQEEINQYFGQAEVQIKVVWAPRSWRTD